MAFVGVVEIYRRTPTHHIAEAEGNTTGTSIVFVSHTMHPSLDSRFLFVDTMPWHIPGREGGS